MASLRDIRKRIKSVKSTEKITKAMKMVAAAKLRRAQEAAEQSNPYAKAIGHLLANLSRDTSSSEHPWFRSTDEGKDLYIVFSSDRGLCGAFNSSIFRKLDKELKENTNSQLVLVGKKACAYFGKKQTPVLDLIPTFWNQFNFESSKVLAEKIVKSFEEGSFKRVILVYNEFISVMSQKVQFEQLLPMTSVQSDTNPTEPVDSDTPGIEYQYEASKAEIFIQLISKALYARFYRAALHSQASEFGARMTAMDSATRNAGDMIDKLTLHMNRVRQANITRELVEIISGAEAIH